MSGTAFLKLCGFIWPVTGHSKAKAKNVQTSKNSGRSKKYEDKRQLLASSAAAALCKLGYANTSMRDIAKMSGDPLSALHYYFDDRIDLITFCVRNHKMAFLAKMESALVALTLEELISKFSIGLSQAATYDASQHRLWFDIRNQAIFTPAFQPAIDEIETAIISVFEKIEEQFMPGRGEALLDYVAIDGLFRHIVQSPDPVYLDYSENLSLFERQLRCLWRPLPD